MKFTREPTLYLQALSAAIGLLVAIGIPGLDLTAVQSGAILAVTSALLGAVNAALVRPIAPAAFTGLVGAAAALATAFGFEWSQESIGAAQALVVIVLGLVTREQVTPVADPAPAAVT